MDEMEHIDPTLKALRPHISPDFDLERFVRMQDTEVRTARGSSRPTEFESAIQELRNGRKTTHWIWYIFPQAFGLGTSVNTKFYGIKSIKEATAYLAHPILGPRLKMAMRIVLDNEEKDLRRLLGSQVDVDKLKSCVTLFAITSLGEDSQFFVGALNQLWGGKPCERTEKVLSEWVIEDKESQKDT